MADESLSPLEILTRLAEYIGAKNKGSYNLGPALMGGAGMSATGPVAGQLMDEAVKGHDDPNFGRQLAVEAVPLGLGPRAMANVRALQGEEFQPAFDDELAKSNQFAADNPTSAMTAGGFGGDAILPAAMMAGPVVSGVARGMPLTGAMRGYGQYMKFAAENPITTAAINGGVGAGSSYAGHPDRPMSQHAMQGGIAALIGSVPGAMARIGSAGVRRAPMPPAVAERASPELPWSPAAPMPEPSPASPTPGVGPARGLSEPPQIQSPASGSTSGPTPSRTLPPDAPFDQNAYHADVTKVADALRNGTDPKTLGPATFDISQRHGVQIKDVVNDIGRIRAQPPAPVVEDVKPPPKPPRPKPSERQYAEQDQLKNGVGVLADKVSAIEAAGGDPMKYLAKGAARDLRDALGSDLKPSHIGRVVRGAKAWAQDAGKVGKSVGEHLRDVASDPKTFVPMAAGGIGISAMVGSGGQLHDTSNGQFVSPEDPNVRVKRMRDASFRAMRVE